MSGRLDYFFRQTVTESELDLGFALLEQADRDLAADLNIFGIIAGAAPAPHSPVPDLTVDLTAPARAYDHLGQRMFFGTGQSVDCAVDLVGIPTDVATAGNERWLGIFMRFKRQLSDPRTDGNSQQVFFRRDESFELVVRQAPEAAVGVAPKPALQADELLLCDIRRRPGQSQIIASDIDTSRRQAFIFAQSNSVAVESGMWNTLQPVAETVQAALDETDAELSEHFTAIARRHGANAIDFTPHGLIADANNVQDAVNELVDGLSATVEKSGADRVGARAMAGTPRALAAGSVGSHVSQLLSFLNAHLSATTGAHSASAIAAAPFGHVGSTSVQAQLQQIVKDLASDEPTLGASLVGVSDQEGRLDAQNIEHAFEETLKAFESDHFRGNESYRGQHRTLHIAPISGSKVLLLDSNAAGGAVRFRIYAETPSSVHADTPSIWFTQNASWNGSNWVRDASGYAGGFRFSSTDFEIFNDNTASSTIAWWANRWRLAMNLSNNSAFTMRGSISEIGRFSLGWTNTHTAARSCLCFVSTSFRNRLEVSPSSLTITPTNVSQSGLSTPTVVNISTDGFDIHGYQTLAAGTTAYMAGYYTSIA